MLRSGALKVILLMTSSVLAGPAGKSTKIVGGTETVRGEFPWMAYAGSFENSFLINYPNGGSLVNERCVLTLSTTLTRKRVAIILGAYDLTNATESDVFYVSEEFFNYTGISAEGVGPGIVVLPERVNYTQFIQPIRLYDPSIQEQPTDFVGETGVLTGWGHYSDSSNIYSYVLRKVETPIITNQDCEAQFAPNNVVITDDLICTSGARGVGACDGDSGGPVNYFNKSDGLWTQIGIIGFGGNNGCQVGNPTVSFRPGYPGLIDWIESICGPLPATRPGHSNNP